MATDKNQYYMSYLELLKKSEFPISFYGEILRGRNAKDMIKILAMSLKNEATDPLICDILETKIEVDDVDLDFDDVWNASELNDMHEQLMKLNSRQNAKLPIADTDLTPSGGVQHENIGENSLILLSSMAATQQKIEFVPLTEEIINSLNCPVCFEIPSKNQIYQCENGHTTCLDCYSKIQNNKNCCPQCRMEMFKTRFTNFVSNNVLPRISIKCSFIGCTIKKGWLDIKNHEKMCFFGQAQRKLEEKLVRNREIEERLEMLDEEQELQHQLQFQQDDDENGADFEINFTNLLIPLPNLSETEQPNIIQNVNQDDFQYGTTRYHRTDSAARYRNMQRAIEELGHQLDIFPLQLQFSETEAESDDESDQDSDNSVQESVTESEDYPELENEYFPPPLSGSGDNTELQNSVIEVLQQEFHQDFPSLPLQMISETMNDENDDYPQLGDEYTIPLQLCEIEDETDAQNLIIQEQELEQHQDSFSLQLSETEDDESDDNGDINFYPTENEPYKCGAPNCRHPEEFKSQQELIEHWISNIECDLEQNERWAQIMYM